MARSRPSAPGPQGPGTTQLTVSAASVFYGGMVAVAYTIVWFRTDASIRWSASSEPSAWLRDAVLGVGVGLGLAGTAWALAQVWTPARQLEERLTEALGVLAGWHVLVLAFLSGLGEEVLFRGVLQPWWGLWVTSAVFGVVHGLGNRALWVWTVTAFAAGALLGGLAEWTGGIVAPVAAHMAVNAVGLRRLSSRGTKEPNAGAARHGDVE